MVKRNTGNVLRMEYIHHVYPSTHVVCAPGTTRPPRAEGRDHADQLRLCLAAAYIDMVRFPRS